MKKSAYAPVCIQAHFYHGHFTSSADRYSNCRGSSGRGVGGCCRRSWCSSSGGGSSGCGGTTGRGKCRKLAVTAGGLLKVRDAVHVVVPVGDRPRRRVNPALERRPLPVDVHRHAVCQSLAVCQTAGLRHVLRHHRSAVSVCVVKSFPHCTASSCHRHVHSL